MQSKKECWVCHTQAGLERHHPVFGSRRKLCVADGLSVWLCAEHHRGTKGVHGRDGHEVDIALKQAAERAWMRTYEKTVADWVKRYGKNYL